MSAELAALGVAAKEGIEAAEKVKNLEKEVKTLTKENKQLAENFNSERVSKNLLLGESLIFVVENNWKSLSTIGHITLMIYQVLRKKYYNMVEDMKGKIRVYCRARPMSKSELDRVSFDTVRQVVVG